MGRKTKGQAMKFEPKEQVIWSEDLDEAAAAIEHACNLCGDRIVDVEVVTLLDKANRFLTNMVLYVPEEKGVTEIALDLNELVEFMCWRFESAKDLESLSIRAEALKIDKEAKADYTLVNGALDRMRASYKKRSDELKGTK